MSDSKKRKSHEDGGAVDDDDADNAASKKRRVTLGQPPDHNAKDKDVSGTEDDDDDDNDETEDEDEKRDSTLELSASDPEEEPNEDSDQDDHNESEAEEHDEKTKDQNKTLVDNDYAKLGGLFYFLDAKEDTVLCVKGQAVVRDHFYETQKYPVFWVQGFQAPAKEELYPSIKGYVFKDWKDAMELMQNKTSLGALTIIEGKVLTQEIWKLSTPKEIPPTLLAADPKLWERIMQSYPLSKPAWEKFLDNWESTYKESVKHDYSPRKPPVANKNLTINHLWFSIVASQKSKKPWNPEIAMAWIRLIFQDWWRQLFGVMGPVVQGASTLTTTGTITTKRELVIKCQKDWQEICMIWASLEAL
jgi:hypothetical protein